MSQIDVLEMLGFVLTYVFIATCLLLFLFFARKIKQARLTPKELLPFIGIAALCLSNAIAHIVISWFDYYQWNYAQFIPELWQAFCVLQILTVLPIIFLIESVYRKTRFLVSIFLICSLAPVIFLQDFEIQNMIIVLVSVPSLIVVIPLYYLAFLKIATGFLKKRLILAFLGIVIVAMGAFLRSTSLEPLFGFGGYLISYISGTIVSIVGAIFIGYGFAAFSTFTDIAWKTKMREIYVINDKNVCLYAFSFDKKEMIKDTELQAGGFAGIQALLAEMVKTTETLQLIDYKNLKIMLEKGGGFITVLVLKEGSSYLQYKLKVFVQEFQAFFKESLAAWLGDLAIFTPTKALIRKIFEINL